MVNKCRMMTIFVDQFGVLSYEVDCIGEFERLESSSIELKMWEKIGTRARRRAVSALAGSARGRSDPNIFKVTFLEQMPDGLA